MNRASWSNSWKEKRYQIWTKIVWFFEYNLRRIGLEDTIYNDTSDNKSTAKSKGKKGSSKKVAKNKKNEAKTEVNTNDTDKSIKVPLSSKERAQRSRDRK